MEKNRTKVLKLQKDYIDKIKSCQEDYYVYYKDKKYIIKPNVFPLS